MILATVFTLLMSGSGLSEPTQHILLGYKEGSPFVFEAGSIGADSDGKTHFLQKEAAHAFNLMANAAFQDGVHLDINYGYRSLDEQRRLRRVYKGLAAKPGKSPHQQGIAIDLNKSRKRDTAYKWLRKNASKFGFYNTIRYEPWHWEYKNVQD